MGENKKFWNDAAKYGAFVGLATILFAVLKVYLHSVLIDILSLAVFLVLIYSFTKRRAALYTPEQGFGYGQGLVFILSMTLFAGILQGGYLIADANWINPEIYEQALAQSTAILENMGFYTPDQLDSMTLIFHSPLFFLLSGVMGSVFKGLFFGLIVAALTKREPNIFSRNE